MLVNVAWPRRRDPEFSFTCILWNQTPALTWCRPVLIESVSVYVNRFRRLETPAAFPDPPATNAPPPPEVCVPPIVIPPGPPGPATNEMLCGNSLRSAELKLYAAREIPARNVLSTRGENTCVSDIDPT